MSPHHPSRRSLLATGGLVALGLGLHLLGFASDDDRPGAEGFTAKSAPAGSDPLVLIDPDGARENSLASAVAAALLDARQFDDVPDAIDEAFEHESTSGTAAETVGKLVLVGTTASEDAGGAVVWADWTDDDLTDVLGSAGQTTPRTRSYRDRTVHTIGDVSAAVLGDTEFAIGTPDVVRDVVDVWHDDADPVGGPTLRSFERTPLEAPVRFSFETLGAACNGASATRLNAYDEVAQVYGWVPPSGDAVRFGLSVASTGSEDEVATAVRSDLGAHTAGNEITVDREVDAVSVEYSPRDSDDAAVVDVIETIACPLGR